MMISTFDELLQTARQQPLAQHLLLVYTQAELPDDSTQAQRDEFAAGMGGVLTPAVCVDKRASEIESFAELEKEAREFIEGWDVLFAAAMDVMPGQEMSDSAISAAMNQMIELVKSGQISRLISFDREGNAISLA